MAHILIQRLECRLGSKEVVSCDPHSTVDEFRWRWCLVFRTRQACRERLIYRWLLDRFWPSLSKWPHVRGSIFRCLFRLRLAERWLSRLDRFRPVRCIFIFVSMSKFDGQIWTGTNQAESIVIDFRFWHDAINVADYLKKANPIKPPPPSLPPPHRPPLLLPRHMLIFEQQLRGSPSGIESGYSTCSSTFFFYFPGCDHNYSDSPPRQPPSAFLGVCFAAVVNKKRFLRRSCKTAEDFCDGRRRNHVDKVD